MQILSSNGETVPEKRNVSIDDFRERSIVSSDNPQEIAAQEVSGGEPDDKLLLILLDSSTRRNFLRDADKFKKMSSGDWDTLVNFCTYTLNWSWGELANSIPSEAKSLLDDYRINSEVRDNPEKAWTELLSRDVSQSNRNTLIDREVLIKRASATMAKANPAQFMNDLSSFPEGLRKECLEWGLPGLMAALEPAAAIAAVIRQLNSIPIKYHNEVLQRVFSAAMLHPTGDQSVRQMLNSLPEGPERQALTQKFNSMWLSATREDPLQ